MNDEKPRRKKERDFDPEDKDSAWEGPAAENAYPEDEMITIDGVEKPANEALRYYNKVHGLVDEAAVWQDKRKKNKADDDEE